MPFTNYSLNLFFTSIPTTLAIAAAGELQSRRYVHVTSVPDTFLDRQLRGMRHLACYCESMPDPASEGKNKIAFDAAVVCRFQLLAALLGQDFGGVPRGIGHFPAPFSTHQIRAASASLLHASTKLYCSSISLGGLQCGLHSDALRGYFPTES